MPVPWNKHRKRTGKWPTEDAGPVLDAPGELWRNLDAALRQGTRGLRGGRSLARLAGDIADVLPLEDFTTH